MQQGFDPFDLPALLLDHVLKLHDSLLLLRDHRLELSETRCVSHEKLAYCRDYLLVYIYISHTSIYMRRRCLGVFAGAA